jgi:uncharacterized protein (DUF433 family)
MPATAYPHIETNADGIAFVSGTTTKVIEIVQDHLAHHWDAEDIHRQIPHLGLAQIHAALAFYYDHQEAMDREIESRRRRVAEIKARRADSALQDNLSQLGRLP